MPNITEQDIIDHLEKKIQFHYSEAKRIENILLAFKSGGEYEEGNQGATDSIKLKSRSENEGRKAAGKKVRKAVEIPQVFSTGLKLNGKVIFALNQIRSGFAEDIANKMVELQPELDAARVKVQISGVLSSLKAKGVLDAKKVGRKDLFTISQNVVNI
jgi:hypothetical protein